MLVREEQTISAGTHNMVALVECQIVHNDCSCEMIIVLLTALHVYLPSFMYFICVIMIVFVVCACIRVFINELDYGTRVHLNTWGECHKHRKGIRKRDDEVWILCNIWGFWHGHWWMCRWTMAVLLHMCSGFPTERLEQMIITSLYDITRVSCSIVGGNYKRGAWLSLGVSSLLSFGCFNTSIWVFNKPQTLYFSCLSASWVGNITRMHSVICLSICMHPDLFGGLWVIVTSFIWRQPGRPLPSPLESGIKWSTDHNPSVANWEGGINC